MLFLLQLFFVFFYSYLEEILDLNIYSHQMGSTIFNVFTPVSIILIGKFSQPPGLFSFLINGIKLVNSEPGVGGTKIQDLKLPSEIFFLLFLSILLVDLHHSLLLHIGFRTLFSSFRVLLYPFIPPSILNSVV